ncbi:Na+/H+ antiporter [Paenibacillus kyungheensis]|uniref:Na+/H+ antiporter n=1 Tax=Paenibacillus kyungheensis TaxID=1452732 RepID=A0AAX3LW30_9BACL|nr:Na+/H+ antiporter [Paenibacillus kyungheensis]WCT53887.1 Na+/H+ antiporter [Paenibacillus kyungheensis]
MEYFIAVLVLLLMIGISNILNRLVPLVPVPLFQIALGIIVSIVGVELPLDPELFLVLFIAPLLYNDGRRTPRDELWNLRVPIIALAFGLVFATVLIAGYAIHSLIPSIPLPAAFALAAILSPTDAVAVGSLAKRVHLPQSIHRLLEGESLLNDASGLVAFKFAVAATVTGTFSLWQASFSFILVALGGLALGALMSFILIRCQVWLRRWGMEDITVHVLWQILTPFVIYLLAEEIGVSGILAVVAGGIVHAMERDRAESVQLKMQLVSTSTWSVLVFVLNGLVFMILGVQIPEVMGTIFQNVNFNNGRVLGYVVLITLLLYVLRFIWIYAFWSVRYLLQTPSESNRPSLRGILLTSLSGVRGALTLAAAFSIPYVLNDGTAFPERELILFIAAGVILLSLILASIFLPLLSSDPEPVVTLADKKKKSEKDIRLKILEAAVQSVHSNMNDSNQEAARNLIAEVKGYMSKSDAFQKRIMEINGMGPQEMEIYLHGIHAERTEVRRLRDRGEITAEMAMTFEYRLDRLETVLRDRSDTGIAECLDKWKGMIPLNNVEHSESLEPQDEAARTHMLKKLKLHTSIAAIESIQKHINPSNQLASNKIIARYEKVIHAIQYQTGQALPDITLDKGKLDLITTAIQNQRDKVQELYESGEIDRQHARKMRHFVQDLEKWILMEN